MLRFRHDVSIQNPHILSFKILAISIFLKFEIRLPVLLVKTCYSAKGFLLVLKEDLSCNPCWSGTHYVQP